MGHSRSQTRANTTRIPSRSLDNFNFEFAASTLLFVVRKVPGYVHDGVITLLERHPEILLELWADAGGPANVATLEVELVPNELRITFGTDEFRHFRPDMVMRLLRRGRPYGIASLEAQGVRSPERPFSWEICDLLLRRLFGQVPHQFVVPLGRALERWVQRQIALRPALQQMCVLGPSKVARIESLKEARARPYHAALAVAVHRHDATPQMCRVALRVLSELSDEYASDYTRMVLTAVPRELGRELLMGFAERELKITAVEREGYLYNKAYDSGLRAGARRGRKKGLEQGLEQGLVQGLEQGLEQGLVTAVSDLLVARGLDPNEALLARMSSSKDHSLLRRAVVLAGTASSLDELTAALWPNCPSRPVRAEKSPRRPRRR